MRALKSGDRLTKSGRPVGRPRVITPEKAQQVADLTLKGFQTRQIAQHTGLKIGTVRWVRWAYRAGVDPTDKTRRGKPPLLRANPPLSGETFPSPNDTADE